MQTNVLSANIAAAKATAITTARAKLQELICRAHAPKPTDARAATDAMAILPAADGVAFEADCALFTRVLSIADEEVSMAAEVADLKPKSDAFRAERKKHTETGHFDQAPVNVWNKQINELSFRIDHLIRRQNANAMVLRSVQKNNRVAAALASAGLDASGSANTGQPIGNPTPAVPTSSTMPVPKMRTREAPAATATP